jgi:hypothetical protein
VIKKLINAITPVIFINLFGAMYGATFIGMNERRKILAVIIPRFIIKRFEFDLRDIMSTTSKAIVAMIAE